MKSEKYGYNDKQSRAAWRAHHHAETPTVMRATMSVATGVAREAEKYGDAHGAQVVET